MTTSAMVASTERDVGSITLRDYQQSGVSGIRSAFAQGASSVLFVLPTGGGKTVTFAYVAERAVARGNRVLVMAHREELVAQISGALYAMHVEHGLIAAGRQESEQRVQVASVQTLARRVAKHPGRYGADLIVVDEAHHAVAGSGWGQIIDAMPGARLLGVTATPIRLDGRGLGRGAGGYFDALVDGPSVSDLIGRGYLAAPRVFAPPHQLDLSGLRTRAGDFAAADLAGAVDKPVITGDAVAHYARLCPGQPAIAFCASVAHAEHVAEQFRAAGWQAAALDGKTDPVRRRQMIADLGAGALHVLTACDVVSEGTDIPRVMAAILLRPTQSEALFLQQVGRAMRACEGKTHALILDHAGNTMRHGLPTEDRQWSLDGRPRRAKKSDVEDVRITQCPACYSVHEPGPACPHCGHEYPVKARATPQQDDADLIEVDADAAMRLRRKEKGAARSFNDLVRLAKARGYKNPTGWAAHVHASRRQRASV